MKNTSIEETLLSYFNNIIKLYVSYQISPSMFGVIDKIEIRKSNILTLEEARLRRISTVFELSSTLMLAAKANDIAGGLDDKAVLGFAETAVNRMVEMAEYRYKLSNMS